SSQVLKLIADSLRYWVQEMHVDGFRFDLAVTLGREPDGYDPGAAFFDIVHQDPVLARTKLIAEPWDVGDFGYQVGNLPVLWSEWNGKYRDNVRKFWKGVPMLLGGDEMGRTQQGNNNAYCQDSEISWFDWNLNDQQRDLLEFTRGLIVFRGEHPVLRRRRYFEGLFLPGADIKDLTWFKL